MTERQIVVYPGQRVIGTDGKVHTVAYTKDGQVFSTEAQPIQVCGDAWGGEYDQEIGIAA
jgi:hypothetical protein